MKPAARGMFMQTPANDWREGLPCGNGELCGIVYGSVSPETILFNHDRLWYMGKTAPLPDMTGALDEVRRLEAAGDMEAANEYYSKRMYAEGFAAAMPIFHPAFDLKMRTETKHAFAAYRRSLNFETGEASVRFLDGENPVNRRFFISRADNVGVLNMTCRDPLHLAIQLCEHNLSDSRAMDGIPRDIPLTFETKVRDGMLVLNVTGSDGGEYGAVLRLTCDGDTEFRMENSLTDQLSSLPILWGQYVPQRETMRLASVRNLTAVIGVYVNVEDADAAQAQTIERLKSLPMEYDALLTRHTALHGDLFRRCLFTLGDEYRNETSNEQLLLDAYGAVPSQEWLVKQFDYGRYLLLCCSGERCLPPTLQGSFNGDYFPPWNSFYVHNENTQMFYWHALPARAPELMGAVFSHFERFLDDYRRNARDLFGCRGIYISLVGGAHTGLQQDPSPHVMHFTGVAAWIGSMYYDYWRYTRDKEFLKNRAMPFIREVARFYEDYLTTDGDGFARIYPSNSPENAPANSVGEDVDLTIVMNPGIPTTINSTIDTALAKETFSHLLEAYDALGLSDDEDTAVWREWLGKFRVYRINSDGALAEWVHAGHTDNYAHRHLSHIYPFFPGHELAQEESWKSAVRAAVDKRMENGMASQTGWSLVHLANIYARLSDSKKALECLHILASSCVGKNLFTYHNDWRNMGVTLKVILSGNAPYQIDANMGFTAAVMEMLVYSYDGFIRVFPALPQEWESGSVDTLGLDGNLEMKLQWDRRAGTADISLKASSDTVVSLLLPEDMKLPGGNPAKTALKSDEWVNVRAQWITRGEKE